MTTYALAQGQFTPATIQAQVGKSYHLGLSATLPDGSTRAYGYLLEPDSAKSGGFHWRSDTTSKDALTSYSSGELIDRDLAFFPRVTDGDFSGGGYQEVFIDPKHYFDSDLDPRVPGYLQLRSQWARVSKAGLTVGTQFQVVAWKGDFWFTFGESNGNVYSANGGTTTVPTAAAVLALDTDGSYLYAGTSSALYRSIDGVAWAAVTTSINGTATQWWVINQGTNGYFAYYQSGPNLLYKLDLTQLSYKATVLADGAQRYYRLGESAGTVAVDIAGNVNGAYVNAPTLGVAGAIVGDPDTAVTFAAASSQKVTFTPGISGNSRFSIECWMHFAVNPAASQEIVSWGANVANQNVQLFLDNTGKITLTLGGTNAGVGAALSTVAYHHVVATWDGTTARVYVDGVAYGATQTPVAQNLSNSNGRIATSFLDTLFFSGTVDEVAIYPVALSATQVLAHFNSGTLATATSQPQVPVGANAFNIVDLVEYQTSIAILTDDVRGSGFDLWYFDGNNLTRIIRVEGYVAQGICQALGSLYISAYPLGQTTSPVLAKVESGSYEIVAKPGSPFPAAGQSCLQPRASSQFVYWPILNPSIKGISSAPGVVLQYDVLTGAVSHLSNFDATDFTTTGGTLRAVALLGENAAICYINGTTGILQYQQPAFGTIKYATNGWLVGSRLDFGTPGIAKRFRRIEVTHSPLKAGERIDIEAFVDQDPLGFTTALAPVPSGATAFNATVGSTLTVMTVGADTIGKALYFALRLTAGTSQNTSPRVSYITVEVGGTWAFEVNLACTAKRLLLGSLDQDAQGLTAKDLAYLPMLAYENGAVLTLYHRNGQSYSVAIESLDSWNPSPQVSQDQQVTDEEWIVKAILRQVA